MRNRMRPFVSVSIVVALVAVGLFEGITARKPRMNPEEEELLIQEGDELEIKCRDEGGGEIKFSTQKNMARVSQSGFNISFNNESGWYTFTRLNTRKKDTGWYACAEDGVQILNDEQTIDHPDADISWIYVYVNFTEPVKITSDEIKRVKVNDPVMLSCYITGYPVKDEKWRKLGDPNGVCREYNHTRDRSKPFKGDNEPFCKEFLYRIWDRLQFASQCSQYRFHTNKFEFDYPMCFDRVLREDNGTYECTARDNDRNVTSRIYLIVEEVPEVTINFAKAVGAHSIYLNLTVYDGNDPVKNYHIKKRKSSVEKWENSSQEYSGDESSFVVGGLEKGVAYHFVITADNSIGRSQPAYSKSTKTLEKDLEFVPQTWINRTSDTSVTIGISAPPSDIADLINYYDVRLTHGKETRESVHPVEESDHLVLKNLTTGTKYSIEVAACCGYTKQCGDWSTKLEAIAIDEDFELIVTSPVGWTYPVIFAVLVLLIIIMVVWMIIWKRGERAARRRFIEAAIESFKTGDRRRIDPNLSMAEQAELLPYDNKWEFPRNLLIIGSALGSGAFGVVKRGRAKSICKGESFSTVAVKMVRATDRLDHMMALQRELKILAHLGKHLNIVNLLGACTNRISYGELLVIVEYCRFGNLRDYLLRRRNDFVVQLVDVASGTFAGQNTNNSCTNTAVVEISDIEECSRGTESNDTSVTVEEPVTEPIQIINYEGDFTDSDSDPIGTRDLLCWAWQVSRGMNYLSSKRVVHGDLAARNILLSDNNVVKICDFGLAKALYASDIYKKEGNSPLPVKWMPIESIGDRVFSVKSDVWSFGVVLWELFTLGKTPYPGIANESVYTKLVDGYRMERPEYATEQIYRVMLSCWDAEPSKRPSFKELVETLDQTMEDKVKEHYLDFDAEYAQINEEALANGGKDVLTMNPAEYLSTATETNV